MYLVEFHKRQYNVPQQWNELTGRQLVKCMEIIHGDLKPLQKQLKLLQVITGMNVIRFFFCPIDELQDKLYLTLFLLTTNHLTKNLIPAYDELFGPADNFGNLTAKEFAYTEHYFQQCDKDPTHADLNQLVGVLFRDCKKNYDHRLNPDGDHREGFNDKILDYCSARISHWPKPVKLSVFTWYAGCRGQLAKEFPRMFGGDDGGEVPKYGMWSIMRSIAEKGNHGTFKDVENMLLKEMMMELTELAAEADRLEELSKQQSHE